uniref:Uncharacterized protein n=1 Tax=viral metagenome TaxID=1070528 RepID=A0A6C0JYC9_9ZZZZ
MNSLRQVTFTPKQGAVYEVHCNGTKQSVQEGLNTFTYSPTGEKCKKVFTNPRPSKIKVNTSSHTHSSLEAKLEGGAAYLITSTYVYLGKELIDLDEHDVEAINEATATYLIVNSLVPILLRETGIDFTRFKRITIVGEGRSNRISFEGLRLNTTLDALQFRGVYVPGLVLRTERIKVLVLKEVLVTPLTLCELTHPSIKTLSVEGVKFNLPSDYSSPKQIKCEAYVELGLKRGLMYHLNPTHLKHLVVNEAIGTHRIKCINQEMIKDFTSLISLDVDYLEGEVYLPSLRILRVKTSCRDEWDPREITFPCRDEHNLQHIILVEGISGYSGLNPGKAIVACGLDLYYRNNLRRYIPNGRLLNTIRLGSSIEKFQDSNENPRFTIKRIR